MTDYSYLNNTVADIRLLGVPNIFSPFCQFDSAPRVSMFNHHLSQAMTLNNPEFNKMFTGQEHKAMDYSFNSSKRTRDCEVVAIIPKYRPPLVHRDNCPEFYVITLTFEPNGERYLDYFTIQRYFMGQNGFGWIPQDRNLKLIREGAILEKDTVITSSPAVNGNQYAMGINANTIYASFPETIEDAFVISQSLADRLTTTQVEQKVINFRMDHRPLNLNGDKDDIKFIPHIGELIREDAALCGTRPMHWTTTVADADPTALLTAQHLQDNIIYGEAGGRIVDLTFNVNRNKINDCFEQAKKYTNNNTLCYEEIFQRYLHYKNQGHKLTPAMQTLVTNAIYRMFAQGSHLPALQSLKSDPDMRKVTRNFDLEGIGPNGSTVDFMQLIVTYTKPRFVSNGTKLSDCHGAKGVVGLILPDDWMPVDEYGMRADLWIDMNSPVSRNNPGQLYETGMNRVNEFARRKVAEVKETVSTEAAFDTLMEWYGDVNSNYRDLIIRKATSATDRKNIVEDAIATSPKINILPFLDTLTPSSDDFWNALVNIKKWANKWGMKSSPVRYKSLQADGSGKEFITEQHFNIGSKYIFCLHKIPEITAPGPASVNHIGVPTKASQESKHFPVSVNPYRFGEDELRVMLIDGDPREVTRFQNLMANSPLGATISIQSILLSEHPTRITRMPISNGDLFENSSVLKLFHGTTATLGFQTKSTSDVSKLQEALSSVNNPEDIDQLADSIWQTELVTEKDEQTKMFEENDNKTKRSAAKRSKIQKMLDLGDTDDDDSPDEKEITLIDGEVLDSDGDDSAEPEEEESLVEEDED